MTDFVKHPFAPDRLLSQNSELRKTGVWGWTLPAFHVRLSDGTRFNACPNAGPCARVCYARFGTYKFSNVLGRHRWNLEYVLEHPDAWEEQMLAETGHKRFNPTGIPRSHLPYDRQDAWLHEWIWEGGRAVRIHDAGDFFSRDYFDRWIRIAAARPNILFYAYTKEVAMILPLLADLPQNLRIIFSFGGIQDELINRDLHRNADVFPNLESLIEAGYFDQGDDDVLAAIAPTLRIGIVQNNLPVAIKRFAGRPMSGLIEREEPA